MSFHTSVSANQASPPRLVPAPQMAMQVMDDIGASGMPNIQDQTAWFVQKLLEANIQMRMLMVSGELKKMESPVEGCKARKPVDYFRMHSVRVKGTNALPQWVDFDLRLAATGFTQCYRRNNSSLVLTDAGPMHVSTSSSLDGCVLEFHYEGILVDEYGFPYCDLLMKGAYTAYCEWKLSQKRREGQDKQAGWRREFNLQARNARGLVAGADITKDQIDQLVARIRNAWDFGGNVHTAANNRVNNDPMAVSGEWNAFGGAWGGWGSAGMNAAATGTWLAP